MAMKLLTACMIVLILLTGASCAMNDAPVEDAPRDVALEEVLSALDDAGIPYESRPETRNAYDIPREGVERRLYRIEPGFLTIYIFPNVDRRRKVQRDPFPAAEAVPPTGSYGVGSILVFYYEGDDATAQKLAEAFEPLGVEEEH